MKRATLLAAILVLATMSLAQEGPNSVSFESAVPVTVAPGHTAQVTLVFKVGGGYHINSHKPAEGLIATELSIQGTTVSSINYPPGQTYEGTASIVVRFDERVKQALRASLRYQPCDESACLSPVVRNFEIAPPVPSPGQGEG